MLSRPRLSFYGGYTYRRQVPAEILVEVGAGTALLGQFILARIFQPSDIDITLLFAIHHTSFLAAPWLAAAMRGRSSKIFYAIMLALAPTALCCTWFLDGFWGLGPPLAVANFAFVTLYVPLRGRMMSANYDASERGVCYGRIKRAGMMFFFGLALAAAFALEREPEHIHWILPVAGLVSAFGIVLMRRIKVRGEKRAIATRQPAPLTPLPVYRELFSLFRRERRFLLFQIGFLLYGAGFMFTVPREISAVSKVLELPYTTIVIGIYGVMPLFKILLLRPFGQLLDSRGPNACAAAAFALLMLYPLCIWSAIHFESVVLWLAARAAFGLAMAGVELVWNMGPLAFGEKGTAAAMSGAHVFSVGARASVLPFVGELAFILTGNGIFVIGAVMLGLAALWMRRLDGVNRRTPDAAPS